MAYTLPRMEKCCCISLRTGSLVIGYVSIVISALFTGAVSWSLYKVVMYVNSEVKPNPEHTAEEIAKVALGVYISHAYLLLVLLYYFFISLLLVIGVHMNNAKYMRYYFKAGLFLLALALALVVVTTIFLGLLATIPLLKWSLTLFFCLIVVRSTYLQMEEQNKPRVYEMQTLYTTQQAPLMA
ncbi:PREDICTED: uncharacterized protein LOC106101508 isoform X2 [Papilio polytes]|uniref:uncharacterized protein LOC106101508 isoform X2 n=1 Tax=Papilio polytes TaxID=76194 RepID=UPI00067628FC|nr:PREDICTED: uncharacterized protein LOC106101508 isoform X2 [Papilio polytes]